jgi:ADP-ribose pyrophosphatase YjhB (NUDIX family)
VTDPRLYPDRPFLAVSAAIFRDGKVLLVRRARAPATGVWTLPGGVVEVGETLVEAILREVEEETGLAIAPIDLAGYRNVVVRDADGRVARHFVVLPFAAHWIAGEFAPSEELSEAHWTDPSEVAGLETTDGLAEVIANAARMVDAAARDVAASSQP